MRPSYPVSRLDYALPPELIAQHPPARRGASRLLHIEVGPGRISDRSFNDLPCLLPPATLLVLNDSRVIPARLIGERAHNAAGQGGGRVEVLYLRYLQDGVCEAVVGANARLQPGERIALPGDWQAELLAGKGRDGAPVRFLTPGSVRAGLAEVLRYLEVNGQPPLPPYIKRGVSHETDTHDATDDKQRYQTVYARHDGSAAAPTAGLHFEAELLQYLEEQGHSLARVTLHVGLGTFAPVRVDDLRDHVMHEEAYSAGAEALAAVAQARREGRSVLAVGTTSLRVLHTLHGSAGFIPRGIPGGLNPAFPAGNGGQGQPPHQETGGRGGPPHGDGGTGAAGTGISGLTDAFIYPGQGTQACDLLLTNFHLPRSTLLALVYAFGGEDLMRQAYAHAVAQRYRFFSYGDCMLIDRR